MAAALIAAAVHLASPGAYDFVALYAAAHLAATGQGSLVTDAGALLAAEHAAIPARTVLLNDPNPPALAALMAPLGALPYAAAYAAMLAASTVALALSARRLAPLAAPEARGRLLPFALLSPPSLIALAQGQTTPLLLLAAVSGATWLLVLRPQLLPLYAVALLRSRRGVALLAAASVATLALSFTVAGPEGMARWPERLAYAASEIGQNEVSLPALARRATGSALFGIYASGALLVAFAFVALRYPRAVGPLALLAAPHALLHDLLFAYPAVAFVARTPRAAYGWCVGGTLAVLCQLAFGLPAAQVWLVSLALLATRSSPARDRPAR